jgi:uncharacterized protein with PIN domain
MWVSIECKRGVLGMKFIADCMLGRLAKWLRMMGFDTTYIHGAHDDELVRLAVREDRILLTRDHLLAERRIVRNRCIFINSSQTREQMKQIFEELSIELSGDNILTRCALCNGEIWKVSRETVTDEVPPYVYKTQNEFGRCTSCGKVYWKGSHVQHVLQALAK